MYNGDWSENALPIFHALKAGTIPAFRGQTFATILFNLDVEKGHMPRRLIYFNQMRAVGWAEVRPSTSIPGYSEVTIPVMDGGLAELAVPRSMMLQKVRNKQGQETSVVVIVRLGTRALQLPRITDGTFKDWPNTLISKPSGTPGITHAAERARTYQPNGKVKYDGVLFPFITER